MEIVTLAYNRPDFIELQYNCLKKWVKNFTYTIYDNCPDDSVKDECKRLEINCVPIKIFSPKDPSRCVGLSLNKMWETLKNTKGKLVYLDSDMFLINELPDMGSYDFAFVPQNRPGSITYPWTGLMMFNMDTLPHPEKLRWDIAPQLKADVGGLNHFYLKEYSPKVLELEMWTIVDDGKFSFNGADTEDDRSYGEMEKMAKKYNFPRPYSFDIFRTLNKTFVFHYKSASNYPSFYTKDYNKLKTEALKKILGSEDIFEIENQARLDEIKQYKIDVIIPVWNGEKFIINAIDSVLNQTFLPHKIIVVDDGSNDKTYSLVSKYAENSKVEIRIIKKVNGGLSSARNTGIKESTVDFVAFLDADDVWLPDKLKKQIEKYNLSKFKNLGLVYCDYDVIDSKGIIKYKNYKSPLDKKKMRGKVFKKLLERNQITSSGSGVLIKREVFKAVGLFDEKLKWGEDWDMWLRIAEKFEVDFVPEILVHIRKHESNMTVNPHKAFEGEINFYNKWVSAIDGRYPVPLFWSDKIAFKVTSRWPNLDFVDLLREKMPDKHYRILFRNSFGSLFLYIPLFFIRQVFNLIFYPNYLRIFLGFVRHTGI